ncbi:hypothetical protein E2C01_018272 [Portunus trituberculatus]|uniref:Endonuclease/exonuclease/phosphatase domain-containing protein n=1 Tax=Portunus trituberculatus TaxID=210409 RepID=A0A5B7DUP1_PORTR|nr:hypothetical protein [Portunus trituberculatus]
MCESTLARKIKEENLRLLEEVFVYTVSRLTAELAYHNHYPIKKPLLKISLETFWEISCLMTWVIGVETFWVISLVIYSSGVILTETSSTFCLYPFMEIPILGDFNIHNKLWLSSPFPDHPGELAFNFAILHDVKQLVNVLQSWQDPILAQVPHADGNKVYES